MLRGMSNTTRFAPKSTLASDQRTLHTRLGAQDGLQCSFCGTCDHESTLREWAWRLSRIGAGFALVGLVRSASLFVQGG